MKRHNKILLLLVLSLLGTAAVFISEPIPQDIHYHNFADSRTWLGLPNAWNVLSSLPFLLVGAAGLTTLRQSSPPGILTECRNAYSLFFTGVLLTGFGSAYYHLNPDNSALAWDRLPMSLSFMAFLSIMISENVSLKSGRKLMWPLIVMGMGSVLYWHITEQSGRGDLRPYVLTQFLPVVLIPLMLLLFESRFDRKRYIWIAIALYVLSKLLEHLDAPVFATLHLISGHSLKHFAAAGGAWIFYLALKKRVLLILV